MNAAVELAFRSELREIEMEKTARLWPRAVCADDGPSFSESYKGTPFYERAVKLEKEDAESDVVRAKFEAERSKMDAEREAFYAKDSARRAEIAQMDAELLEWRKKNPDWKPGGDSESYDDKKERRHKELVEAVAMRNNKVQTKTASAKRVDSGVSQVERAMAKMRKVDHTEQHHGREDGIYAEKTAAPFGKYMRSFGKRLAGGARKAFGTRGRRAAAGALATGAAVGGAAYARKHRGTSQGLTGFVASIPSKVRNSKIFQTLVRKAMQRFPDVPKAKIEELVYQAMKEKGVLHKVAFDTSLVKEASPKTHAAAGAAGLIAGLGLGGAAVNKVHKKKEERKVKLRRAYQAGVRQGSLSTQQRMQLAMALRRAQSASAAQKPKGQ